MISAAIYVPPDAPLDGIHARRCHDRVIQCDYRLVAILRTWEHLDRAIRNYGIQVIISACEAMLPDRYRSHVAIDLAAE